MRQSQIVQSVMQDCTYVLSHLLPVCNLLVQGPKVTYQDRLKFYCGVSEYHILIMLQTLVLTINQFKIHNDID